MIRRITFSCFLMLALQAQAQEYVIEIGGKVMEISLDKKYEVEVSGKKVAFQVHAKDTLVYNDDLYSFKYLSEHKVSRLEIDEGIEQILLMTAEGSGVLIQKYTTINPTILNELMINEVTKESLDYGYSMERQDYKKTLKSGQTIKVDKAVLTYKGETNIYEVATIGQKDEGIVIMTMIMDMSMSEKGQKIINMMWSSLVYK